MCSVVSVTMKSEYELVSDAVLGTDLHLSEYSNMRMVIARWLCVDVDVVAGTIPPSTLVVSCTVITINIVVIVQSGELPSIVIGKPITSFSSKPSNSQWVFFTGTSYTELIVVEVGPGLVFLLIIHSHLPLASLC